MNKDADLLIAQRDWRALVRLADEMIGYLDPESDLQELTRWRDRREQWMREYRRWQEDFGR